MAAPFVLRQDYDTSVNSRANFWRTAIFVCFVGPGPVIGLVPYWLSGWHIPQPVASWRYLGVVLVLAGAYPLFDSIARFVREGRGTPEPLHPTAKLVVSGLYRYVRNPMYLGVIAMIAGQAVFFANLHLAAYALIAWCVTHCFVLIYEEPVLRARYGAEYEKFRSEVPRWIPRFTPRPSSNA